MASELEAVPEDEPSECDEAFERAAAATLWMPGSWNAPGGRPLTKLAPIEAGLGTGLLITTWSALEGVEKVDVRLEVTEAPPDELAISF